MIYHPGMNNYPGWVIAALACAAIAAGAISLYYALLFHSLLE